MASGQPFLSVRVSTPWTAGKFRSGGAGRGQVQIKSQELICTIIVNFLKS